VFKNKGEYGMRKILVVLLVALALSPIFSIITTVKADEITINPTIAPESFTIQESRPVYSGSDVLVIQDVYTWGMEQLFNAPDAAACSDLGISHDVITSATFKDTELSILQSYKAIVLMADQPQSFYQNLFASKQKLADYVDSGGVLSAVVYRGWIAYVVTEQFLPGGVTLNYEYCDDVDFNPTHFIISNPDRTVSLDGPWGYNTIIDNINQASSFYFTNLPSGSEIIAEDAHGHDVFVEYSYGSGKVLAVGIPIQWFYRYKLGLGGTGCEPPWDGENNLKLLYNELLYQSGLISLKERLIAVLDKLKETASIYIAFLARLEARMNAIAYMNLQFDTVRFIAKTIIDLASMGTIGGPPSEVADLKSLKYLTTLSTILTGPVWGIRGVDIGFSLQAADDYIKDQGLSSQDEIEEAYLDYIMGSAAGQVAGTEKKMPFVQGSDLFYGLQDLVSDIETDYLVFKTSLDSFIIPETESTVELIQYLNNLENTLSNVITTPSVANHIAVTDDREFVYDNELGYLLNLKDQQQELVIRKDQAQLISDACMVAKGAAVVAKIVNILALGALTPIQIGVTLTAVSASAISTVSSSVELCAKSLIFGNKLQSIVQMGSEIAHVKQILDDTEDYVIWRMTHAPPLVEGEIVEFVVPEVITDGMSGDQVGSIVIKNTGSSGVWAMTHIHILGPTASAENKMMVFFTAEPSEGVEVGAGSQEVITFDYSVLDLSHIEGCIQYEARAYVSFEGKMIGPEVRFFKAGCECESSSSDIMSGEIMGSETEYTYISIDDESVEAEFELFYAGSDLDLHLYDQQGNHVGINYNTLQIEISIPGAMYSGVSANPEWIKLPVSGGNVFQVAVAAISVFGAESYTVTLTEFFSYHSPSLVLDSIHKEVVSGEETTFKVSLQNRGNLPDAYELAQTGLDETWIAFSQSLVNLNPGEMSTVTLAIHPQGIGIIPGDYSFLVTATCTVDPMIFDSIHAVISVIVVDNAPPSLTIETPSEGAALQDGVTLTVLASDPSGVDWVAFSIREPNGEYGTIIDLAFESMMATHSGDDEWTLTFDTIQLPDGYYIFLVKASDMFANEGNATVQFSIRNWACLELLPATESNKAGRTMPVKFSLRVFEIVDPAMPFVYNEELTIIIYEEGDPDKILQTSTYGDTARDYRIDSIGELYITNFRTIRKKLTTYVVEIYRKDMLIGSFEFTTVK